MSSSLSASARKAGFALALSLAAIVSAPVLAQSPGVVELAKPRLEVPIPGVNLVPASVKDGVVTVGFLAQYVGGVYTFLLSIVGVVAAVVLIAGGFFYLTSAGNPERVKQGKKMIFNALTGLVLAYGSYTVLWVINPDLVRFRALQLNEIDTVGVLAADDHLSNEHLTESEIPTAAAQPESVGTDSYAKVCTSPEDCLPYCKMAGCTKIFCTKAEIASGYSPNCINSTRANDCDWDRFPKPANASILDENSADLIPSSRWPTMPNIRARAGTKASQLVVDGLRRADAYISQRYSGQNLTVQINNCWRNFRDDFNAQCSIIARPTKNSPTTWFSSWPGAGPHSSGYACDMVLYRGGKPISGTKANQKCSSTAEGSRLLIDIMTNPGVGARRLNYESWHFNWAGWNSCYCAGAECEKHIHPVGSGSRKCFDQVEPLSC